MAFPQNISRVRAKILLQTEIRAWTCCTTHKHRSVSHGLLYLRSWGFVITSKAELAFLVGEVPKQVYLSSVAAPGHFSSTIPISLGASFHADPAGRELQACLPASKETLPPRKGDNVSGTPAVKSWAKGQGLNYRTLICSVSRDTEVFKSIPTCNLSSRLLRSCSSTKTQELCRDIFCGIQIVYSSFLFYLKRMAYFFMSTIFPLLFKPIKLHDKTKLHSQHSREIKP